MEELLERTRACTYCEKDLPQGPRPVLQASRDAKLLIIGQAPGLKVHKSGVPWDDASGDRLRKWLGISKARFYNEHEVGILPMAFCYPGKGERGDLPPRKECYPLWHEEFLTRMPSVQLTLLIGNYAQVKYLGKARESSLTETVRHWRKYLPGYIPLPHPSPTNNIWLHKNRWFEKEELPAIRKNIARLFR